MGTYTLKRTFGTGDKTTKLLPVKVPALPPTGAEPGGPNRNRTAPQSPAGRSVTTSNLSLSAAGGPAARQQAGGVAPPARFATGGVAGGGFGASSVAPIGNAAARTLPSARTSKTAGALTGKASGAARAAAPGLGALPRAQRTVTSGSVQANGRAVAIGGPTRTGSVLAASISASDSVTEADAQARRDLAALGRLPAPNWLSPSSRSRLAALPEADRSKFAALAGAVSPGVRQDLESLLSRGLLGRKDGHAYSLLDYLYSASRAELASAAKAAGLTSGELASRLVANLARPNDVRQTGADDCVWANVTRDLAAGSPVDYARFNLALYTKGFSTLPGTRDAVKLPSPAAGLLASSGARKGTPLGSLPALFPDRAGYSLRSSGDRLSALQALALANGRNLDVPAVLSNPDGTAHMVTVSSVQGDRLEFYDPVEPDTRGQISVTEFLLAAKAVFLPKEPVLGLPPIDPEDKTDVGRRFARRAVYG